MIYLRRKYASLMGKPCCGSCEKIELRRQARVGFLERVVLARFGYYPWECGLCRKITFLPQRFAFAGELSAADPVCGSSTATPIAPLREPLLPGGIGPQPSVAAR